MNVGKLQITFTLSVIALYLVMWQILGDEMWMVVYRGTLEEGLFVLIKRHDERNSLLMQRMLAHLIMIPGNASALLQMCGRKDWVKSSNQEWHDRSTGGNMELWWCTWAVEVTFKCPNSGFLVARDYYYTNLPLSPTILLSK